jgi:hypothetical protein
MDSILLDVIALVPNPRAGLTRALGPSPARELAENAFLDDFWGQIGRHVSGMKDCRRVTSKVGENITQK